MILELVFPVAYLLGMSTTTWLLAGIEFAYVPPGGDRVLARVLAVLFWPITAVCVAFVTIHRHGKKRKKPKETP